MIQEIPKLKADFFKTLGHPLRIRSLELLSEGELSVSELCEAVGSEQSHLSQQLGILRRAGFVKTRREGSSVIYSLADPRIEELLSIAKQMLLDMLTQSRDELQVS
jgi:ArsR family transcriptional regulator